MRKYRIYRLGVKQSVSLTLTLNPSHLMITASDPGSLAVNVAICTSLGRSTLSGPSIYGNNQYKNKKRENSCIWFGMW